MNGHERTIAIIGTLDTKAEEVAFLAEQFESYGRNYLIIDIGVLGKACLKVAICSEEVARQGGSSLTELQDKMERALAVQVMTDGLRSVLQSCLSSGRAEVFIGLGGGQGSRIITRAYQSLPFGVPKVLVSTIASGNRSFNYLFGNNDMIVMNSVADFMGLHQITETVLTNAAAVANGLATAKKYVQPKSFSEQRRIAFSVMGVTSKAAEKIAEYLKGRGYNLIPFHATGGGGAAMESLVRRGYFHAVADLTLHEICSELLGGFSSGTKGRLTAAGEVGILQVVVPGGMDFIDFSVEANQRPLANMQVAFHNDEIAHIRLSEEETLLVAQVMARRLNAAAGPVVVIVPTRGFSNTSREGQPLFNANLDAVFLKELKRNLAANIEIIEVDAHLEDDLFCKTYADTLDRHFQMVTQ